MTTSDPSVRHDPYIVKSVVHATEVIAAFKSQGEVLRLREVVKRTGLAKALCFRQLYTLRSCGYVEKVGDNLYRSLVRSQRPRRYRIGYATPRDSSFSRDVIDGLVLSCQEEGAELIQVDNKGSLELALRNAQRLIDQRVDLAVEFQDIDAGAGAVAAKFQSAGIPLIAVDIPHPGAIYFGANNFEAGLMAGRHLGEYAIKEWQGRVEEVLIIETAFVGRVSSMRVEGILTGLGEAFPPFKQCRLTQIDGEGKFRTALTKVRNHLRTNPARRVLVGATNDLAALGALRAFQEVGRDGHCAVVGQNAEPEARHELRQLKTSFIGTVAYFPEKYGQGILRLALDMLAGKSTPLAVFTKHKLITPQNVNRVYPNDFLTGVSREYS